MTDTRKVGEPTKRAGNRGMGRPKGSKNKTTIAAKVMIEAAAEGLGGHERMIAWAKEDPANERAFWASIFPRLLPLQVTGEDGGPIQTEEVGAGQAKLATFLDAISSRASGSAE